MDMSIGAEESDGEETQLVLIHPEWTKFEILFDFHQGSPRQRGRSKLVFHHNIRLPSLSHVGLHFCPLTSLLLSSVSKGPKSSSLLGEFLLSSGRLSSP